MNKLSKYTIAVVINTHSRQGKIQYRNVKKILKSKNIDIKKYFSIKNPRNIESVMKNIVKDGYDFIILGGGDGTISTVVDFLAYKDITLGLLPLGTSNSFVRSLRLPLDLESAIDVIIKGKTIKVDLGMINNDYFANVANIGFSTLVARTITKDTKRKFGRFAYIITGFYHFFKYVSFKINITTPNGKLSFQALEVIIANGRYQNGLIVSPLSDVTNDNITIVVVSGNNRWDLLKVWIAVLRNKSHKLKNVTTLVDKYFYIETSPRKHIDVDGEVTTKTPIKVQVAEKSLKVRVSQ